MQGEGGEASLCVAADARVRMARKSVRTFYEKQVRTLSLKPSVLPHLVPQISR